MEEQPTAEPNDIISQPKNGLTIRSIFIAVILTILSGLWVRQAELIVYATQISTSVPPVPALSSLILLIALNPILKLIGKKFTLTRQEILATYCFVSIAIAFLACGSSMLFYASITAPFYLAAPSNKVDTLFQYIPSWLTVKNPELIKSFYEGGLGNNIPWRAWLIPFLSWTAFFIGLWLTMLCLIMMVKNRWSESERLQFPIVELPLELTSDENTSWHRNFFKNKVMWAGFGVAAIFNLSNILHVIFPAVPALGVWYYIQNPFPAPWSAASGITMHFRPETIGFGFLVPTDICFSIWAFTLISKLEIVYAYMTGADIAGMPFEQEQSIGAFLVLGVWLLWQSRKDITAGAKALFNKNSPTAIPRWALPGFILGFIFLTFFCVSAGMAGWVAVLYLAVIIVTVLVTFRVRAEVGIPMIWLFPFYQQKKLLLNLFGTAPFNTASAPATLTMFAMLAFLSRGFIPAIGSYQIESLRIADRAKIPYKNMIPVIIFAFITGICVSFYIYLSTYYQHGAQTLPAVNMWTQLANNEYTAVVAANTSPVSPDSTRTIASICGGFTAATLLFLKSRIVGFPLHPLGYAVSTAYGPLLWSSFFIIWIVKLIIIRIGGMKLYRQAIPFFLGLALGHFFLGSLWSLTGLFWPDGYRLYKIIFG